MAKLQQSQNGFGAIEALIVLIVFVLIGFVGYFGYKNYNAKKLVVCKSSSCFSQRFQNCYPATYNFPGTESTYGALGTSSAHIIKKATKGCTMSLNYPNIKDASFTCDFNDNEKLNSAVEDALSSFEVSNPNPKKYNCSGPFVSYYENLSHDTIIDETTGQQVN